MKVKDMFIEFINKTESIISTMDEDMRIQWLSTKVSCSVGIILLCVGTILSLAVGVTACTATILFFSIMYFSMSIIICTVTILCMPKESTDRL